MAMHDDAFVADVTALRRARPQAAPDRDGAAEGGCGVVGLASTVPVPGRHLVTPLAQMRNRGNGKGGGIAAVGLDPAAMGVAPEVLAEDYLLAVAYVDPAVRDEVERTWLHEAYCVDHAWPVPQLDDWRALPGLEVRPPEVVVYFVRPRADHLAAFWAQFTPQPGLGPHAKRVEDEYVHQTNHRFNVAYYAGPQGTRAFVLSQGKDLLVLKMVGYAEDVIRYYRLDDFTAHVWIGHHRYPTKGRVWHPGGAHPFVGLNEALVHNGDFANYQAMCDYLAQRGLRPLFQTDTEVAAQVYDLHRRTYGYPLEYVIESLAPTTERDFTQLPPDKQAAYAAIQATHIHGSPDGPWFFIIAESLRDAWRLIGITDTSMLRPQVFALQAGPDHQIAFAASEKQVIDAVLGELAAADDRFWGRADRYWAARGGSHSDGGAFVFEVTRDAAGAKALRCSDKFGHPVTLADVGVDAGEVRPTPAGAPARPPSLGAVVGRDGGLGRAGDHPNGHANGFANGLANGHAQGAATGAAPGLDQGAAATRDLRAQVAGWSWNEAAARLDALIAAARPADPAARAAGFAQLAALYDGPYDPGALRVSQLYARLDDVLVAVVEAVRAAPCAGYRVWGGPGDAAPAAAETTLIVDAAGLDVEGPRSLARVLVERAAEGWRRFVVVGCRGHRFIGAGLGPESDGVTIDVFGASGDYLASGIDGATVVVHGSAQDQLAQIMKRGTLVVHGDVGQAFMYGAKGGQAFVRGDAAGRPLINAVGRPRVVINGTCLDYLAESFMAGDPLRDGGFVVLLGLRSDGRGGWVELETPYAGGNLFSLASGGAIYVRDPRQRVTEDQLNGGAFVPFTGADWAVVAPMLEANAAHFGLPVARLLTVDGAARAPEAVFRKIAPGQVKALQAEEAWVAHAGR